MREEFTLSFIRKFREVEMHSCRWFTTFEKEMFVIIGYPKNNPYIIIGNDMDQFSKKRKVSYEHDHAFVWSKSIFSNKIRNVVNCFHYLYFLNRFFALLLTLLLINSWCSTASFAQEETVRIPSSALPFCLHLCPTS